ncbi:MAG: RNA 2'-phosphotransferase [Oscillospiraceae bacterium]|nr:RNA 2'-phosphotransferase [Oscillospiraceae bacterium]
MNLQKIGVELSYLLRHCKEPLYVDPEGGWAQTETMITVLAKHFPGMNREVLEAVVAADNKGRFSFDDTRSRIRANQGHSIPSVRVDMQRMDPPEFLFHGTSDRFLPAIMEAGLKPMSRQFVHLSSDVETAVKVGKRHGGKTVVLKVHAKALAEAGSEFLLSANSVWQVKAVPPEYLEQMVL